jgi:hypothetical protein
LTAAESSEDASGFRNDLAADAVAWDDCNLERDQGPSVPLIIRKDLCIITMERCYALPLSMIYGLKSS